MCKNKIGLFGMGYVFSVWQFFFNVFEVQKFKTIVQFFQNTLQKFII